MLKLLRALLFGSATSAIFALNLTLGHAESLTDRALPPSLCKTTHGRRVCEYLVRCQPSQVVDQFGVARLIYADFGCAQERYQFAR